MTAETQDTKEREALEIYSRAAGSLVDFRGLLLLNDSEREFPSPAFHFKLSDILLTGEKHFAVQSFRESGKTQYVTRSYPLYCLTFPHPSRDYVPIIKANDDLAASKLKEIEREFLETPLLSQNLVRVNVASGDAFEVVLEDGDGGDIIVRLEAYGKGASVRGLSFRDRRPKVVIIDDPQDTEDAESETTLEKDWNWFLSDVKFLAESSRIFLIGNNLGAKSIIERVFQAKDDLGFETERIPALTVENVSAWPEKVSTEKLLAEKESYRRQGKLEIWVRERMCESIAEEEKKFRREDFQYYTAGLRDKIAAECNVFIRTDLAGDKIGSNWNVIEVYGVNPDGLWFILDVQFGNWNPSEFIDRLFSAVIKWRPQNAGLEKVAYQAAMEHFLKKEMPRRNVFFNIVEQTAEKQKELRISQILQPRVKAHSVFFPDEADWLAEVETELLMFPKGTRDDVIDTLAYNEENSWPPVRGSRLANANLPREAESECALI